MGSVTTPFNYKAFINTDEVLTSSELLERIEASGINKPHARKLLARSANAQEIWRSEQLILSGGGRLFAHQWGSPDLADNV